MNTTHLYEYRELIQDVNKKKMYTLHERTQISAHECASYNIMSWYISKYS